GSSNGTWINGVRLERRRKILPGDEVLIGQTIISLVRHPSVKQSGDRPAEKDRLIVADSSMKTVLDTAGKLALCDDPVLITGETGTGKGIVAVHIHKNGPRSGGPFIELHCAALNESIIERELFGCEKGAYTGATQRMPGFLEAADGGTLFLDEICEIPLSVQVKLLRFLDGGTFSRLGSPQELSVDTRIIAATNRNIRDMVERRAFRSDLYFRISSFILDIPPLRTRQEDIEALTGYFIERSASRHGKPKPSISPAAMKALKAFPWEGNIRHLRNVIERIVVFLPGQTIGRGEIRKVLDEISESAYRFSGSIRSKIAQTEEKEIVKALEACGGNQSRAARLLGITRRTLGYKIKKLGINPLKF
ncbi:MAG: sigma 54-interacting transcriptional regulator, partial [Pseudomonadota bacterium]